MAITVFPWIKPVLDEALSAARKALETCVDHPDERDLMHACVENLHQVRGALLMLGLHGEALFAGEMEQLASALFKDAVVTERGVADTTLMRALLQFPDYLEAPFSGHQPVPEVLLPLLNELRACRGLAAPGQSALFVPDLDAPLPIPLSREEKSDPLPQSEEPGVLHQRFQQHLLAWFHGQTQALGIMRCILDRLVAHHI